MVDTFVVLPEHMFSGHAIVDLLSKFDEIYIYEDPFYFTQLPQISSARRTAFRQYAKWLKQNVTKPQRYIKQESGPFITYFAALRKTLNMFWPSNWREFESIPGVTPLRDAKFNGIGIRFYDPPSHLFTREWSRQQRKHEFGVFYPKFTAAVNAARHTRGLPQLRQFGTEDPDVYVAKTSTNRRTPMSQHSIAALEFGTITPFDLILEQSPNTQILHYLAHREHAWCRYCAEAPIYPQWCIFNTGELIALPIAAKAVQFAAISRADAAELCNFWANRGVKCAAIVAFLSKLIGAPYIWVELFIDCVVKKSNT